MIQDQNNRHTIRAHCLQAAKRLVLGVPIALVMFVMFPRIASPLWGFSEGATARTGLAEQMRPGQISSLVSSSEVAFRVEFKGAHPPRDALYWRGPVLDAFTVDGQSEVWEVGASALRGNFVDFPPPNSAKASPPIEYAVTLQPHNQRWIFALDFPAAYPRGGQLETTTVLTSAQQLLSRVPVREAVRYSMTSLATDRYPADATALRRNTGTGDTDRNPRARAWAAEEFARVGQDSRKFVASVLQHIRRENFVYTVRPPLIGRNFVDNFWFDARRGFCEHYAGSFAFVMRSVGIPARVVTGYLGGERNPQNDTLIVRQSDAHAWTEVLLDGQWQRVDPTAFIAPNRVELDLAAALPAGERSALSLREYPILNFARHLWDASQHAYTEWLIGFDRSQQKRAMDWLGLGEMRPSQSIGVALLGSVCALLATIGLYAWRERARRGKQTDIAERYWLKFIQRMRRNPIPLPNNVTPRGVIRMLSDAGDANPAVIAFCNAVERARFSDEPATPQSNRAIMQAYRAIRLTQVKTKPLAPNANTLH